MALQLAGETVEKLVDVKAVYWVVRMVEELVVAMAIAMAADLATKMVGVMVELTVPLLGQEWAGRMVGLKVH